MLGGLEVVETVLQAGVRTVHPLAVAFFTDEEGARFQPDMLGSLVYIGGMALEDALDVRAADDGARLGDELARIGYAGPMPCPSASAPHAYFELHIEQGPVLEDEGITIGVVTGVQGISWTEVTLRGQSAHAGTTPMRLRHDPGVVAAAVIRTVQRAIAAEMGGTQVATVGRLERAPEPGERGAGVDDMTVDLRNTDEALLQEAERRFQALLTEAAADEHVDVEQRTLARFEPVEFDASMVDLVDATAQRLGLSTRRMPSGAGHDAQMLARVCPTAMVFVPSVNGLSHNIAEYTEPADITAGANVLLQAWCCHKPGGVGPMAARFDLVTRTPVPDTAASRPRRGAAETEREDGDRWIVQRARRRRADRRPGSQRARRPGRALDLVSDLPSSARGGTPRRSWRHLRGQREPYGSIATSRTLTATRSTCAHVAAGPPDGRTVA